MTKRILQSVLFIYLFAIIPFSARGQNVGIGTTTPTNKLSVNGNEDISGKLGIGTASPVGELQVKSIVTANSTIDQQMGTFNSSVGNNAQWQSFTAGVSGLLTRVDIMAASPLAYDPSPGTVKIFNGEGNGGTLLSTMAVTFQVAFGEFQTFSLSSPITIIAGNKYTIEYSAPSWSTQWVYFQTANPYAGGISSFGASTDLPFKTFVASTVADALVVKNGKAGFGTTSPSNNVSVNGIMDVSDKLGVGTTSPSNKLTVKGTMDITESLGIGTATPVGELQIKSINSAVSSVDQQQTVGNGNSGATSQWQSFTAGTAGLLTKVDLFVGSPTYPSTSLGTIKIYSNEGIGGTLLSTTSVTYQPALNFQSFNLSTFVKVTAGSKYTIEFSAPNVSVGWVETNNSNPYAGGMSSYLPNIDFVFRTYVASTFLDVMIVAAGKVGIGTPTPTAVLSVNGNSNNTTGSWGVFSDARIKNVSGDFTDGLNVIKKMHTVTFNYNNNAPFKADGEQIGIIAQELEKIAPYMVSQKEVGNIKDLREVNNQAYVFLLINAVKELSAQNEQLRADLEMIKAKLGVETASNK